MNKKLLKVASLILSVATVTCLLGGCKSSTSSTKAKPILRVAMEASYTPFNWTQTNSKNGAYPIEGTKEYANGYDVMVAKMICKQIGYTLKIYKTDWDSLILGLNAKKYDALICGMNILPERKKTVNFTTPYRTTTNCVFFRKDSKYAKATSVADLAGCSVVTQMNSNWEPLEKEIKNDKKITSVGTTAEIAAQVLAGKADVGIVDDPTAACICKANPTLTYTLFKKGNGFSTDGQESDKMGIAIRKTDTDLLKKVNNALSVCKFNAEKQDAFMKAAMKIVPVN